ncbi:MAG: hypothetical protein HY257_05460, partial [Chloroflexi bacterium]|nr:hypothetical protein [Chloroflexota bacterium]
MLGKIYIDLVGLDETAAREKLLADISRERGKPTSAPQFPRATRDATPPLRFPGTAPRIWNIPHNRNPNFTGRVDELNQLRAALVSEERATTRVAPTKIIAVTQSQAIHGLGGVGKTQLAVEYAHQN